MWHFAESRQADFLTRRGGFPATCEARIGVSGACSSVSPTASRYTGLRVMQSAADANKVLVEIKTDGKPLRFSILAGDTYYTADSGPHDAAATCAPSPDPPSRIGARSP